MKRYYCEVTHFFAHFFNDAQEYNKEFIHLFREYQNKMIVLMLKYLKEEQVSVQDLHTECKNNRLLIG